MPVTKVSPGKYLHEVGGLRFCIEKLRTAGPRGGGYWSWCVTGKGEKASDFLYSRWPQHGLVIPFSSLKSAVAQLNLALSPEEKP